MSVKKWARVLGKERARRGQGVAANEAGQADGQAVWEARGCQAKGLG